MRLDKFSTKKATKKNPNGSIEMIIGHTFRHLENIKPTKTHLENEFRNDTLTKFNWRYLDEKDPISKYKDLVQRGQKPKKDIVTLNSMIGHLPEELTNLPQEHKDLFFKTMIETAIEYLEIDPQTIIDGVVHYDENRPHLHLQWVPINLKYQGKNDVLWVANQQFNTKKLRSFHTTLEQKMNQKLRSIEGFPSFKLQNSDQEKRAKVSLETQDYKKFQETNIALEEQKMKIQEQYIQPLQAQNVQLNQALIQSQEAAQEVVLERDQTFEKWNNIIKNWAPNPKIEPKFLESKENFLERIKEFWSKEITEFKDKLVKIAPAKPLKIPKIEVQKPFMIDDFVQEKPLTKKLNFQKNALKTEIELLKNEAKTITKKTFLEEKQDLENKKNDLTQWENQLNEDSKYIDDVKKIMFELILNNQNYLDDKIDRDQFLDQNNEIESWIWEDLANEFEKWRQDEEDKNKVQNEKDFGRER